MPAIRTALLASLAVIALATLGCASSHDEAMCKQVKPGVVTTVNSMCVIMNEDPVDPSVESATWKGQKVGFCCNGCKPKWEGMSASERDAAVAKAIAAPKPQ